MGVKSKIIFLTFLLGLFITIEAQNKYNTLQPLDLKWDLTSLHDENISWDEQLRKLRKKIDDVSKLKGLILSNNQNLSIVLDKVSSLRGKAAKLVIYTALQENLNYTSTTAQQNFLSALEIEDEIESATSFINEEVSSIPRATLNLLLLNNKNLLKHQKRINRIRNEAPYRLSNETEKILLGMKRFWLQSGQTHQALFENEKLDWPEFELSDGKRVILNLREFFRLRRNDDFITRINASNTFLNYLEKYKDILAIQLTKRIEVELQIAQLRGFKTGIDAEFFLRDGFPVTTTQTFRTIALKNKELIHRYCSILASNNSLNKPHYSDIYSGTTKVAKEFSLGESIEIVYGATKFLGLDYLKKIDSLLKEPTFHFEMKKDKRIMWAIYPPVGGAKPYTIMPYDGSFRASSVVSRAIIGNLAQHHYAPDTRDDPPVYNNGIIYVGSLLHRDYLVEHAKSKKEKLIYLQAATYGIYNSFFRYAIYANFEYEIEKKLMAGETPNGSEISEIYYNTLKRFFGDDIEIPEEYAYEWMTISQPFNTYEHQYWPVAIAVACQIIDKLDKPEVKDLLVGKVTKKSDRSYQILKEAGIDLLNAETYDSLFKRMSSYLDEIEMLSSSDR